MEALIFQNILCRQITNLLGFLLKLLNCSLVNPTTFVDEMTSGRRLAGVDMTNHDDVDVGFFLTHFGNSACNSKHTVDSVFIKFCEIMNGQESKATWSYVDN